MAAPPDPLPYDTGLTIAAKRLAATGDSHLPVVDANGHYFGVLAAHAVMDALAAGEEASIAALTASAEPVTIDAPIGDILKRLDHGDGAVPVTAGDGTIVGWIRHRDILTALTTTTTTTTATATRAATKPATATRGTATPVPTPTRNPAMLNPDTQQPETARVRPGRARINTKERR
jgi:CBS-domain-containing membrane protein